MRMWMVDPSAMCRQHLLGEHVEIHMIVGHLRMQRSIKGFIKNNCIEPSSLIARHDQLVEEMTRRGYKHKSELIVPEGLLDYLTEGERVVKVDSEGSLDDLMGRCVNCRNQRGESK